MMKNYKIGIQGYEGSFHEEACHTFYNDHVDEAIPCDTFDILCQKLASGQIQKAVMAIENSIAGSILQNYRLLREYGAKIEGEIYLRIRHQLLVNPGVKIQDIKKVYSHPMAINQCMPFLRSIPDVKLIETEDTALSARHLSSQPHPKHAAIASERAAQIYNLEILAPNIETHKHNYTRFYMISMIPDIVETPDKASIYISIPDEKGKLLEILKIIDDHQLNMSKLQSYPVLGQFRAYFFHIDIEFDDINQYYGMKNDIMKRGYTFEELGLYKRADKDIIHYAQ